MANDDLLDQIESEFEAPSNEDRVPDLSLSGTGDGYSDPFEAPGGVAFFEMDLEDSGDYKIKAVGQTAEDDTVKFASDETPITHRSITNLEEATYILNVGADKGASWDIDVYFSSPEPISLPVVKSGQGDDVIGPIPHSGFIKINATNYHSTTMRVKQPEANGKGYINSPSFSIDGSNDNQGTQKEEVMSTKDGRTNYPWLRIDTDGSWEIEVDAHD